MNKITIFFLLNFIVGFLSDLVIRDLVTIGYMQSLNEYFKDKLIIESGIYAGLTIIITLGIIYLIYPKIDNIKEFLAVAFIIGYIVDILIKDYKVFGDSLDAFYEEYSAGLLGSLSIIFTIVISHFIIYYFKLK